MMRVLMKMAQDDTSLFLLQTNMGSHIGFIDCRHVLLPLMLSDP